MGREAECECECNGARCRVKALIEPPELILRGGMRRRLPFSALTDVGADGEMLRFACGPDRFALAVGAAMAEKWARTLTTPPPTLAKKLGITADTAVRVIGEVDDENLQSAIGLARAIRDKNPDLILARVNSPAELSASLRKASTQLAARVPIWFIYPKGRGRALSENDVRAIALAAGIVDTKVCAASPGLTALRFIRRTDH